MRPKSKGLSPIAISAAIHLSLALGIVIIWLAPRAQKEIVDIEVRVIEQPKLAPQADVDLTLPPPIEPPPPEPKARKVFGATRDSLKTNDASAGVAIKAGNTVATAPDTDRLNDNDADRLPIPIEEYLISSPPELLESFKPQYPPEAKERNIEGPVKVEILIDRQGVVRSSRVIQGLGYGTDEAALEAARRLRFKPAEASGQPVAVKIQFIINFELER